MTEITRRQLLERTAKGSALLSFPALLAACGGSEESAGNGDTNQKTLAKTLRIPTGPCTSTSNDKTKKRPTLEQFKQKTGTTVRYIEDVNDNASYFGKIQGRLSRGQSIDRDIVVLTDNSRYPGLLIKKGWAEKLDKSRSRT